MFFLHNYFLPFFAFFVIFFARIFKLNMQKRQGVYLIFSASRRMYFHGLEFSVLSDSVLLIRLNNQSFYQENGVNHQFTLSPGQSKRYFTWPIISNQIDLVLISGSIDMGGLRIFGGTIEQCRPELDNVA